MPETITWPAPIGDAERAEWAKKMTITQYLPHHVTRVLRNDGCIFLTSNYDLPEFAPSTGVWLDTWAEKAPDTLAFSERGEDGTSWRDLTYRELHSQVRAVAAALLAKGLTESDTIAILSGNGLDHLLLSLAGQYVGIPIVPLAEQYALLPQAKDRLIYILNKVQPKLAFVDDASQFANALALPELKDLEIVAVRGLGAKKTTAFADLLKGDDRVDVDAAHEAVGPETLAKILFTSGSSADPKGVLTTHRMLCVNQVQLSTAFPFLTEKPPRLTDWLPWNHVFGGSHNVNMTLANGGSFTIDKGKPTAKYFQTSLQNWIDRPGTLAFNVPVGFAMLLDALSDDADLCRTIFADVDQITYSGASLPQNIWEKLEQICIDVKGGLPLMSAGYGLTETAPACLMVHEPIGRSGVIGVPMPGVEVKLVPLEANRFEIRVKGPNVTPGYFADPEKSKSAFDDEGFFITGDAVRFVDPKNAHQGLVFDGRLGEDFKLETGTWVQAGTLRMSILKALAPVVRDIVVCGHDRSDVGVMIFLPEEDGAFAITDQGAVIDPDLADEITTRLRRLNASTSGSAKTVTRAILLEEPPSVAGKEITDKGTLNVRNILQRREALLVRLYDDNDPAVIRI